MSNRGPEVKRIVADIVLLYDLTWWMYSVEKTKSCFHLLVCLELKIPTGRDKPVGYFQTVQRGGAGGFSRPIIKIHNIDADENKTKEI